MEVAVFNAGNNHPGRIVEMDTEYFENSWRVCCLGGSLFGREALKRMLPKKKGTVILLVPVLLFGVVPISAHSTQQSPDSALWPRRCPRNTDPRDSTWPMSLSMEPSMVKKSKPKLRNMLQNSEKRNDQPGRDC